MRIEGDYTQPRLLEWVRVEQNHLRREIARFPWVDGEGWLIEAEEMRLVIVTRKRSPSVDVVEEAEGSQKGTFKRG